MSAPILIRLAGAPMGKGRPRFVKQTGRAFTPAATRSYENSLRIAADLAMNGRDPLEGPVSVTVTAVFPIPASWSKKKQDAAAAGLLLPVVKPDADNLVKMLDAFNEIVWRDDKQVVRGLISKIYGTKPELVVTVEQV